MQNKLSLVVIFALVIGAVVFLELSKHTSFQKAFMEGLDVKEVTKIEIRSLINEKIDIIESREIEKVMESLADVELKRDNREDLSQIEERYSLTLYVNNEPRYEVDLYDNRYMKIFDSELKGNRLKGYRVKNDFSLAAIRSVID
jgi:hypothetical protein